MAVKGYAIGYTPLSTLAAYQGTVEWSEGYGTTQYLPINLKVDLGDVVYVGVGPPNQTWPDAPSRQQVLTALENLKDYILQGPWPPTIGA